MNFDNMFDEDLVSPTRAGRPVAGPPAPESLTLEGTKGVGRDMTNEEKMGLALIALATPILGGMMGGKHGVMAGAVSGLKGAGTGVQAIADEDAELKKEARAAKLYGQKRADDLEDFTKKKEIEAKLKPEKGNKLQQTQFIGKDGNPLVFDSESGTYQPASAPSGAKRVEAPASYQLVPGATDSEGNPIVYNSKTKSTEALNAPGGIKIGTEKKEDELRADRDRNAITKRTNEMEQSYRSMAASKADAAGDMSLIFQYMKMLDPGSTVREGEFANAENARGVDDKIRGLYNKISKGERLTPEQRKSFLGQAKANLDAQRAVQKKYDESISGIAKRRNVNPENVIINAFPEDAQAQTPPPPASSVDEMSDEEVDAQLRSRGLLK